jgi:mevalonate kinase
VKHHASGKLVLLGEYAVVHGGPALVVAVAHGVTCTVHPASDRRIETPTGDDRFVRAALDAVHAPAARYVFTDREPLDTPGKPGMGGSAAATVAALRAGGFSGSTAELCALGIAVHRGVQGSGSGVDIAAAAFGGGLRFQAGQVEACPLPEPVVVYSGTSAKTGPRVEAWQRWAAADPGANDAFLAKSAALVDAFPDDPVAATRSAWRLLCGMAERAGFAYRTPAIDALVAAAEEAGGAAKPSGAGGGDSVVAFVPDPTGFSAACRAAGYTVLDVKFDPPHPAP